MCQNLQLQQGTKMSAPFLFQETLHIFTYDDVPSLSFVRNITQMKRLQPTEYLNPS
jgi:hypothetical protein